MLANEQAVFEGLTVAERGRRAAESVPATNHLTVWPDRTRSLTYPQDVWEVVTGLHAVTQQVGQTLEPLDSALVALAASGRLRSLDDELGATPPEALGCGVQDRCRCSARRFAWSATTPARCPATWRTSGRR
jgi:hypothetical protein